MEKTIAGFENHKNADVFTLISDSLYKVSKTDQKRFILQVRQRAIRTNNRFFEGMAMNSLGLWYMDINLYSDAYNAYMAALKIFNELDHANGKFNALSNIGTLYYYMQQPKKALAYEFKAYELFKSRISANYAKGASVCLNIGSMYGLMDNLPLARNYFLKALDYYQMAPEDSITRAYIFNNIADTYLFSGDIENAEKYSLIAFDIKQKYGTSKEKSDGYLNLASISEAKGNYKEAAELYTNALAFCDPQVPNDNLFKSYSGLADMSARLNDLKQENKFLKLKYRTRRYLDSISKESEISNNEIKHEFRQQAVNDSIQNMAQIKLRDVKIEQKKRESIYGVIALIIVSLIAFIIFNRYRLTQRQKVVIEQQKHLVEEKNKEITDSINYAKNLQDALIPNPAELAHFFTDAFVTYFPKDIVAGDFYWWHHFPAENRTLIAVADCTGHGVPGAMVSVVCINALNRTVNEFGLSEPNEILDKVNSLVNETFSKNDKQVNDGMDISLLLIDNIEKEVRWSGANNKLIYFEDDTVYGIKPDKQPIGKNENHTPFTLHKLPLVPGSVFYLLTDGFPDQFGGEKNKKLGFAQFKKLMEINYSKPMHEQRINFETAFRSWKNNGEQTDDVSLIGIRV